MARTLERGSEASSAPRKTDRFEISETATTITLVKRTLIKACVMVSA
jgi:hypothetical protein